jgi:CDP-diacylglycerol--glycerol-3-phosphate 3-phosphatidyltransferase
VQKAQAEKSRMEKEQKKSRYETFTDWARETAQVITYPIGRFLGQLGIHPNTVTILGTGLNIGVAAVLASGRLTLGGWLLAIVAPVDAIDGALARVVGQKSRFGAFLDSTLDRVSEAALLFGILIHYLIQGATTEVILAFFATFGAVMVSYTRARAEAADFPCKVGLLTRVERAVVLAVGLILGQPTITLWVLAVGSTLTALHRILYVYAQSRKVESGS